MKFGARGRAERVDVFKTKISSLAMAKGTENLSTDQLPFPIERMLCANFLNGIQC